MIDRRIHWGRIIFGAFFTELAMFAVFIPIVLKYGNEPAAYSVPALALVMPFVFSVWTAQNVESRFVLHGALVGVAATAMYVALTSAQPEPFIYYVAHALKILSGAAGGLFVEKRRPIVQPVS